MKKFLSLLLSFCIVFSSASTVSALDVNIQLPKSLDSFTEDVSALINEYEENSSSDNAVFFTASDDEAENTEGTNRLVVKSSKNIDTLNAINSVSGYNDLHILQFENAEDCQTALEYYSSLSYVEYVQEDMVLKETVVEEDGSVTEAAIEIPSQYQSDIFGYTNAKANMGSAPVTIAVVDTGVQNDHEFLSGRVEPTGFDSVYNESCYDKRGHGTHVAGIIVANTKSNVKIKPYKVIGDDGTGTDTQLYLGIQAAIEDGVDIINLSLTRKGESEIVHEAVIEAYNAGITVVAAAGNDNVNLNETFYTPACFDEVICVVNIDANKKRSSTSNWRYNDTLSAPGVDILSSYIGNTYKVMSGTSMAAPFISSCVAYLFASGDYYTPDEVYNTLYANTQVGATASIHYVVPGQVINSTSTCATPVFTYASGTFSGYLNVKITCATPGATIMYRTSDMNSNTYYEYTGPIRIEKNKSFEAFAYCANYKTSISASASYTKSDTDTSMFIIDENDVLIGYTGTATSVTVPAYFDGGCVSKIAASAFSGNTNVKRITLDKITTTIGEGAFEGCTALTSISGAGITTVEAEAFKNCTSLTTVTMSALLTIGERAFSGCSALTSLRLTKLNTIGDYAFENSSITTLTATKLTTIGNGAFSGSNITSVSLTPVTSIGDNAFEYCDNLTEINLTNKIITLGDNVYKGCKNITSVTLEGITALGNGTFRDCTSLDTVTAESLTKIGDYTFSGCTSLSTFSFYTLVSIGNYSFFGCKSIKELKTTDFPELTTIGDYAFAESGLETFKIALATNIGYKAFGDCAELQGVNLPAVTEFDADILKGSINLERLSLNKANAFDFGDGNLASCFPNLTSFTGGFSNVPDYFFDGCSKLTTVELPTIEAVGDYSFRGTALIEIKINTNDLGIGAFSNMPYLESITFTTVETVDFSSFEGSTNVKNVNLNNVTTLPDNFRCYDIFPKIEYFKSSKVKNVPDYAFKGCTNLYYYDFFDVVTIGEEAFRGTAVNRPYCPYIESVGERAFADCTNLGYVALIAPLPDLNMNIFENSEHTITELNLSAICYEEPEDIAKLNFQKFTNMHTINLYSQRIIPANAFKGLPTLSQIIVNACEEIGANAFADCTALKTVDLTNVTTIRNGAFSGCTGLESFKADKVQDFAFDTFNGCSKLTTLSFNSLLEFPVDENGKYQLTGLSNLKSFSANNVDVVPAYLLSECKKLNTVSFKNAGEIGDYAFYDTALSSYTLPVVTTIGDYAFYSTNIQTFDFDDLNSIGKYAFSDCDKLEEVIITDAIAINEGTFSNCDTLSVISIENTKDIPINAISGCPNVIYLELTQITELPVEADGSTYVSDKPLLEEFVAEYVSVVPDEYFRHNPFLVYACLTSVEEIGEKAFMSTALRELPSNDIFVIGDYAFYGTAISTIATNCVENIGDYAFSNCTSLTRVKIYNEFGDFELGEGVFANCTKLTGVALIDDDIELPAKIFKNCPKLTQVLNKASFTNSGTINRDLLADIKTIGDEAFCDCSLMSLDRIKIADIEHIGTNAFSGTSNTARDTSYALPNLLSVGENGFGNLKFHGLALENVKVLNDVPDCDYVVIGSDIEEFSCDETDTIISAYEGSVVEEFCNANGLNFKKYDGNENIYCDVESLLTGYDFKLYFDAIGFNCTYEWYACNNPDRSDAVLIKTTLEDPQTIDPIALFFDDYAENKYKYFYCVATSTENGNTLEIESELCENIFATIRGVDDTFIDYLEEVIFTNSLFNINTLDNIITVDGDIRVTPSYSNETDSCYGSGTLVEILNGDEVALSQVIVVFGDVNGDGVVDALDVSRIEKESNGNTQEFSEYALEAAADIDRNGSIDASDYQSAVNKALAS